MAIYAFGDIQGCFTELEKLLAKIKFKPKSDQLWFVGDLVNRGPKSLETLRFVKSLGAQAVTVLGNHDIHLLACYAGAKPCKKDSSLRPILKAPDADHLIDWLRTQPFIHTDNHLGYTMFHAGLLPQWDLQQAHQCAREIEQQLQSDDYTLFLKEIYGDSPSQWNENLRGIDRHRVIINAFTRLRFCDRNGTMDMNHKGPPGTQPETLRPWFEWPHRKSKNTALLFGHWSALGLHIRDNVTAIDSGCLWGNQLTAVRLDVSPIAVHQINCKAHKAI